MGVYMGVGSEEDIQDQCQFITHKGSWKWNGGPHASLYVHKMQCKQMRDYLLIERCSCKPIINGMALHKCGKLFTK